MPQDSRTAGPTPPYLWDQAQAAPGLSSKVAPAPDHGEGSCVGKGLLEGQVALITADLADLADIAAAVLDVSFRVKMPDAGAR